MGEPVQCGQCGARNPAGADWCSQCYASLSTSEPESRPTSAREPARVDAEAAPGTPDDAQAVVGAAEGTPTEAAAGTWVCSMCQTANPLEVEECAACGTSIFTAFGAGEEEAQASIDPQAALTRSLVFPGLGHAHAGQGLLGAGLAGVTLMALAFGIAMAAGGAPRFGWPLILLAVAIWVVAAVDAHRIAEVGSVDGILLKPRVITALVGLVVVLVILAAMTSQGGG